MHFECMRASVNHQQNTPYTSQYGKNRREWETKNIPGRRCHCMTVMHCTSVKTREHIHSHTNQIHARTSQESVKHATQRVNERASAHTNNHIHFYRSSRSNLTFHSLLYRITKLLFACFLNARGKSKYVCACNEIQWTVYRFNNNISAIEYRFHFFRRRFFYHFWMDLHSINENNLDKFIHISDLRFDSIK